MYSKLIFYILILAAIVHIVFSIIVLFFPKVINNYTDTTENIVHSIMRGEKTYYREVTSNEKESLKRKTDELDILLKRYPTTFYNMFCNISDSASMHDFNMMWLNT